jgi:hypothetical protein
MSSRKRITGKEEKWQKDIPLFEARFRAYGGQARIVWADIQATREYSLPYHLKPEIVPTNPQQPYAWYLSVTAYTMEPRIVVTVGLPEGRVVDSDQEGTIRRKVGWAQCWYYPEEPATFEIYEALLEDGAISFRDAPLLEDANMRAFWQGVEKLVYAYFPDAVQFSTPHADDGVAPLGEYQAFLRSMGYEKVQGAKAAFVKPIMGGIRPDQAQGIKA